MVSPIVLRNDNNFKTNFSPKLTKSINWVYCVLLSKKMSPYPIYIVESGNSQTKSAIVEEVN